MRRRLVVAASLAALGLAACGVNLGTGTARRVFPNPPGLGALAFVPAYQPGEVPPSCHWDLGGYLVDPVDSEATSPWRSVVTPAHRALLQQFLQSVGAAGGRGATGAGGRQGHA